MDHQPSSSGRGGPTTPRRQLQGPRPPRLNVRMESHAIKKPSASDTLPAQGRRQQQTAPGRAPVIIYDASPKVIHAEPSEFMALVQRLTGPAGSVGAPPPHEAHHLQADDTLGQPLLPPELLLSPSAAMSPAARLATIERSVRPKPDHDGTLAAALGPASCPRCRRRCRPPPPRAPSRRCRSTRAASAGSTSSAPSSGLQLEPRPPGGQATARRRRHTTPTRSSPVPATSSPRRRPPARSSSAACRTFSSSFFGRALLCRKGLGKTKELIC